MSYSPPRVFEPTLWTITTGDTRYIDRAVGGAFTTNTAWIANLAVYVPFTLDIPATVYEWFWYNGSLTTAHNIDFGIYNLDFTKIQSKGSGTGTTTASVVCNTGDGTTGAWTDLALAPGNYYMAFADDSTRNIFTDAIGVGLQQSVGAMEQTVSSGTLPNPMVPVAYTRAFMPFFGMNLRSVAV